MHAALMTLKIDPDQAPAAANALVYDILPRVRSAPGLRRRLSARACRRSGLPTVLFETEEQARETSSAGRHRAAPGVTINGVDFRRVAATA